MSDMPVTNERQEKPCTCHPDDNPPVPCPKQYALSDCRYVAEITRLRAEVETMRNAAIHWHDERDTIERSTIERCAGVCKEMSEPTDWPYSEGVEDCVDAILALKEGER